MHYGPHNSRLSPKAYTVTFICSDVIALILQSAGGALADTAANLASATTGTNVMVAGLSFQVVSLTVFCLLCAEFFWRVKADRKQVRATNWAAGSVEKPHSDIKGFKTFLGSKLLLSSLPSSLANNQNSLRTRNHSHHGPLRFPSC
jgi:hypothetical protein